MTQPIYGTPPPTPVPSRPSGSPARTGLKLLGAVVVVAVLVVAFRVITAITERDSLAGRGQPVTATSASTPVPTPSWDPPNMLTDPAPELEIRHGLEEWLLKSAGVAARTTSRCRPPASFTGAQAASFPCTVTYRKQVVTYEVATKPSSGLTFSWTATAARTVVTRAGLLAAVGKRYRIAGFSDLRCDELPELALVATGAALPQHCYVHLPGRDKTAWIDLTPTRSEVQLETRLQ